MAAALADALEGFDAEHTEPPLPDIVEVDGWVHVSQPVAVRPGPSGITIERIRQSVSPDGRRSAEADAIHLDALTAEQLDSRGRRRRPARRRPHADRGDRGPRRLRGGAAAWLSIPRASS